MLKKYFYLNTNPCAKPTREYVDQIAMNTNNQRVQIRIFNQEQR